MSDEEGFILLFLTEILNMSLYLCPLVVVTGHGMDVTDQSLQGKNTPFQVKFKLAQIASQYLFYYLLYPI